MSDGFREPFCNGEGVIECTMLPNVEKCSAGKVSKCIKNFKIVSYDGACQKCDSSSYCDSMIEYLCGVNSKIGALECKDGVIIRCETGRYLYTYDKEGS